jgi:hypothetical protein
MRLSFRPTLGLLIAGTLALLWIPQARSAESFVNFESGHVRPLAYLPGSEVKLGSESAVTFVGLLFAVNTPDNRLAIY